MKNYLINYLKLVLDLSKRKMKFSSAVMPESFLQSGLESGENFENFYAKTKNIDDIDDDIPF